MCFAPQRRGIFPDQTVQNGSALRCFVHVWLTNVLRATAACHFWKLAREWGGLYFLTWKCASRHSGAIFWHRNFKNCSEAEVFCTFWLGNALRATAACHFSFLCRRATSAPAALASLLFEHQEPRSIEKNTAIRDFPSISRVCIFFLVTLLARWSSFCWLDFSTLLFNCPYCRKLDFKASFD